MQLIFTPLVSVIVPCLNEKPIFLQQSLESLRSQSFDNFECILIDESTDLETIQMGKDFCASDHRFKYLHLSDNVGLAGSLNIGVKLSRGSLIARFDSDDICSEDRLALQVEFLNKNPEIDIVGGMLNLIDCFGNLVGHRGYPLDHQTIEKKFIFSNAMAHPTVMFRKTVLLNSGGAYDKDFKYAEDLELWLRFLKNKVKFANLPIALVSYRQQDIIRTRENWKFNIKARLKNLSSPFLFRKIVVIFGIVVWLFLPVAAQKYFFRIMLLVRV